MNKGLETMKRMLTNNLTRIAGGLVLVVVLTGCGEAEKQAPAQVTANYAVDGDPDKYWDRTTGLVVGIVSSTLSRHSKAAADVLYVDTYSYRYTPNNSATRERVAITGCDARGGLFMVMHPNEGTYPWSYNGGDLLDAVARRICSLN